MLLSLLLLSCSTPVDTGTPWVRPGCGDGQVDTDEECDDGSDNSDVLPDACRTSCQLPRCGDAISDSEEACDDGDAWVGDGCTPLCEVEDGQLEAEPNDTWDAANAWQGDVFFGALDDGDVDCVSVDLPDCAALSASLTGICPSPAVLTLHDPSGAAIATGAPGTDGCASLDPAQAPGARFVQQGAWTVCVSGLLDNAVPFYALDLDPVDPEDATYPIDEADDPDGDGRPDRCDDDRDGDGVLDAEDDCPDTPNGPDMAPLAPDAQGFIRVWLAAGPFTGTSSTDECRPSDDALVAEDDATDDATAQPSIGQAAGDTVWRVLWSGEERIEFLDDFGDVDAPREVYQAVYVYTDTSRSLTLTLGPDDGARAWVDATEVLDISSCQGTVADQFTADIDLDEGWHTLLIKVRDQGGGWGDYVRFLDGEDPVTDLELSLAPGGPWVDDQTDQDGDGQGDVCDDSPVGE